MNTLYGNVDNNVLTKAAQIKLLVCDVDGVFSDGRIYLGNDGEELKAFHTKDGFGIKALGASGVAVAIITGRNSTIVANRMKALNVAHIIQGQEDKLPALSNLIEQLNITINEVAYIGDDVPDFSSTKSYTGHTLAAAGAIEAVFSVLALEHNVIYPNLNFETQMKEFDISPQRTLKQKELNTILSNSLGFGGNCSTLIFSKQP